MVIGCVLKNWLGDVVFASPAIRVIRQNFPAAKIICFAPKRCKDVLASNPYVDQVIDLDERGEERGLFAKLRFIKHLRQLHIDQVYLFHRSFTRALLFFLGGVKARIGYATKGRSFLLTHPVSEPKEKLHSVDYGLELLKRAGLKVSTDALYEFYFEKPNLDKAKTLIQRNGLGRGRVVAVNPGSNWPPKRWPWQKFAELARELIKRYDVDIVIMGGKEDAELGSQITREANHPRIHMLCGETSLRELGALFSLCALVISSDSGPLHIAGGVGTSVLAIFGPTDPVLTGPRGRGKNVVIHYVLPGEKVPWTGFNFPKGWMDGVSVDEVMHTIEREKLL